MTARTDSPVCGLCGVAGDRCSFQRACSCWRGIPCRPISPYRTDVSPFVRRAQSGTLPASDRTAGR